MTTYTLRDYQAEAVKRGVAFLQGQQPGNGLIILPTGSGKSLVIARTVAALDGPCIVFQPSKEILEQNLEKFRSFGYQPAVFSASMGRKEVGDITLATIGSVRKCPEKFADMRYGIIDECHAVSAKKRDSMFMRFFAENGSIKTLGFTATPYRLSTDGFGGSMLKFLTRTRPRFFKHLVFCVQNRRLFDDGHLSRLRYHAVKGMDVTRLKVNSTGADYTDDSVRSHFEEIDWSSKVVRCVRRLGEVGRMRGGVLVFTRFVEEAQAVASQIPGAVTVSAETPKDERARIIGDFRSGKISVVCNVGVLTTGFDHPGLANVVLARPTMSLALYYQMVGRCMRPHPDKQEAWVVDMVGLHERFGKVEDLELSCGPHDTWFIHSQGKQLTNTYFPGMLSDESKPLL